MSYGVMWLEEGPRYEGAADTTPTRLSTIPLYVPLITGRVSPEPVFRNRDDELRGSLSPTARTVEFHNPAATITVGGYMNQGIPLVHLSGFDMTATQGDGTNEVQTITSTGGTPTGGTYTITAFGVTATIPYDATAAETQVLFDTAIRRAGGAATCQIGDVVFGGGALPTTPMTLTYQGTKACTNVAEAVVDDTLLTDTAPVYALTTTTPGAVGTTLLPDGTGLPPSAYRWQSTKRTATTPTSATVLMAYEEESVFEKGQGMGCSTLALGDDGNFTANLLGLYAYSADDPSLTPSYDAIAVEPMMRDRVVTWRSASAMVTSMSLNIANPIMAERNPGIFSRFPGLLRWSNEVGAFCRVTGSIEMDQIDIDDLDAFREADTFAASSHWRTRSKIGSTGGLYQMWVELPACQYSGGTGPEDLAAKRRHSMSFDFEATFDTVAGYDARFTFTSGLSTIASYA